MLSCEFDKSRGTNAVRCWQFKMFGNKKTKKFRAIMINGVLYCITLHEDGWWVTKNANGAE